MDIPKAIEIVDIEKLYAYKNICDKLHNGETVKGYSIEDLPNDELYEDMLQMIRQGEKGVIRLNDTGKKNADYVRKDTGHTIAAGVKFTQGFSELWMGSVPKKSREINGDIMYIPKFDGVSCGIKIVRNSKMELDTAITRGSDVGSNRRNTDVKEKVIMLLSDIINKLELMNEIDQINIRGEIVLKDKNITTSPPAAVVAGKVNGGMDVWNDFVDNIEFVPIEVMRIVSKGKILRPTQLESQELFKKLGTYSNYIISESTDESTSGKSTDESINEKNIYENFLISSKYPIDGYVYCSTSWQYPHCKAETMESTYGKYAWKPTSKTTTTLRQIEYNIARDGKINMECIYDKVNINGKNYSRAKTAIKQIRLLDGMGIGSTITVKLMGDISPMIVEFEENPSIEKYQIIKQCPWCNSKLVLLTSTLKCNNSSCPEIIRQKMKHFLKVIDVKGIAEKKLAALTNVNLFEIEKKYIKDDSLRTKIMNIQTDNFFVALGYGGVKQVNKFLSNTPLKNKDLLSVMRNYDEILELMKLDKDEFVNEIRNYMKK